MKTNINVALLEWKQVRRIDEAIMSSQFVYAGNERVNMATVESNGGNYGTGFIIKVWIDNNV